MATSTTYKARQGCYEEIQNLANICPTLQLTSLQSYSNHEKLDKIEKKNNMNDSYVI